MKRSRSSHYSVRPRYSGGSPAAVPENIALTVAQQELDGHTHALTGAFGEEHQKRAQEAGLRGIVELLEETATGWRVLDLLEQKLYWRPFRARCPRCRKMTPVQSGKFTEHHSVVGGRVFECAGAGQSAETELSDLWLQYESEIERAMERLAPDSRIRLDPIEFMARQRVRRALHQTSK